MSTTTYFMHGFMVVWNMFCYAYYASLIGVLAMGLVIVISKTCPPCCLAPFQNCASWWQQRRPEPEVMYTRFYYNDSSDDDARNPMFSSSFIEDEIGRIV